MAHRLFYNDHLHRCPSPYIRRLKRVRHYAMSLETVKSIGRREQRLFGNFCIKLNHPRNISEPIGSS